MDDGREFPNASQEFLEIARRHVARRAVGERADRFHYCKDCGEDTPQRIDVHGDYELFTCLVCGSQSTFRTK